MALDLDGIKAQYKVSDIVGQRVSLKKNGQEYQGCCPFHKEKTPSFTVNDSKKFYHCFGCGASGDIFDFMMEMDGINLKEAAARITGTLPSDTKPIEVYDPYTDFEPVPFPKDFQELQAGKVVKDIWNPKRLGTDQEKTSYTPSMVHRYTTKDDDTIGYVLRVEFRGGKKITPQIMYCRRKSTGEEGLCHYPMPEPRNIYNIMSVLADKKKPVIVVEGEKCVDVADKVLDGFAVVGWCGGTNALKATDWSVLKDRNVVIFPDADEVGVNCANELLTTIYKTAKTVKVVGHKDKPKGWDIADAIVEENMSKGQVIEYIKNGVVDKPAEPLPVPTENPSEDRSTEVDMSTPPAVPVPHDEFKLLGYTNTKYHFLRYKTGVIKSYTGNQLANAGNLLELAPLQYWDDHYFSNFKSQKKGAQLAANELIAKSEDVGYFDKESIRGRGAWMDGDNAVFHCGEYLIVNGKKTDIRTFETDFIYQYKSKLDVFKEEALPASEANKIVPLLEKIRWSSPINAKLLAGWVAASVVAGCLPWRTHLYMFAPKGSGKTQVLAAAKRLMGSVFIEVQGTTSEAGIRQQLDSDTMPIVFDESEAQDEKKANAMQDILFLARQSSSADGGYILKGSASGESVKYMVRSPFFMTSIVPCLKHDADESRFVQIRLLRETALGADHDRRQWSAFKAERERLMTPEWCKKLVMRSILLIPQIMHNQKIFQEAGSEVFGDARKADTYSMIFAGLYSLYSSKKISPERALEWIKEQDWEEQIDKDKMGGEERMIDRVMQTLLYVPPKNEMAVSEIIDIIRRGGDGMGNANEEQRVLARHRMRVQDGKLWFATNSQFMDDTLRGTPWAIGWKDVLLSMDGAEKSKSTLSFAGKASRAIGVDLETILGKLERSTLW